MGILRRLDNTQAYREEQNLLHLRMYSNYAMVGIHGGNYALTVEDGRLKLNVIKAVIDAVGSKIGTVRPRPMFLTSKGDWEQQRKAKDLNKFVYGQFWWLQQYKLARRVFRDACIFGTGFEKIYPDGGKICIERPFTNEIIVDDVEARYGAPRTTIQHKEVPRETALSWFPKDREVIANATLARPRAAFSMADSIADPISLIEIWRTASESGAKDGRHVICTTEGTLLDEVWTRTYSPIVEFRWHERPLGYFGMGLTEELKDIQLEINYLLQKIQRSMNFFTTQMWVKRGSVNTGNVNNEEDSINTFEDTPPVILSPQSVGPEYFNQLDRLWQRAFDVAGVSELSATGRKPAGLDSGVAIRTQQDVESQRFADVQQEWEDFHMTVAARFVDCARDIVDEYGSYKLLARGDRGVEELDFGKIDLEQSKYIMQTWPTNILPSTPAGKLQTLQEIGNISPVIQQAMISQLDFPDLEQVVSLVTAPIDMADMLLNEMLSHGRYRPPEPSMDLQTMLGRMQLALLRADIDGAPEERLDLVRQFIDQAHQLLQRAQQPAPGGTPGMPGMPPGPQPPGMPTAPQGPAGPTAPMLAGDIGGMPQ